MNLTTVARRFAPSPRGLRGLKLGSAILAVALGVAACGRDEEPRTAGGEILRGADPVVAATVNGKSIFVTDVLVEATRRGVIQPGDDLDANTDEFYQILQDLIETRLLAQEAEARGLDKNAEARHRLENARTIVLAGLLDEHLRNTLISDADLRRFYKENARLLGAGELVHVRHIQVSTRDAALAAKTRLDRGEPFETVAFEVSQDRVTGGEGGDLGFRAPESFPEGLQAAIQATAVGAVAGPVQSELGWHMLKVEERRRRDAPTFEAMRPRLVEQLYWEELRGVVEKLKTSARIELFIDERTPGVGPRPGLEAPADGATPSAPRTEARPAPAAPAAPAAEDESPIPRARATPAPAQPAQPSPAPTPEVGAGDVVITPDGDSDT